MAKQKSQPVTREIARRLNSLRPTPENWEKSRQTFGDDVVQFALAERARQDPAFVVKANRSRTNEIYRHIHNQRESFGYCGTADVAETDYDIPRRAIEGGTQ